MSKSFNHIPTDALRKQKLAEKEKPIKIYNPYGDNIAKGINKEEKIQEDITEQSEENNGKLSLWDKVKAIFKLNKSVQGAIYKLQVMVYAPENKTGLGIVDIKIPNKKEYNKVKKAMKSNKNYANFIHLHGDIARLNFGYPIVCIMAIKVEPTKESGIILPDSGSLDHLKLTDSKSLL